MKLKLQSRHQETADVTTFIFKPEQPISWQAGQYLKYTLPHDQPDDRGINRFFTIAAAPHEGHVQITTRFSPKSSSFKKALEQFQPNDEIEAGQPEGDFVVTDPDRHLVFIAGGIGVTPFRAILNDLDHRGTDINVTFLYGNSDQNVVFKDELAALAAKHSRFEIRYIYAPEQIDDDMIKALPNFTKQTYYISGPEPMVEAFEKRFMALGIPEAQLQRDYFPGYVWPSPQS